MRRQVLPAWACPQALLRALPSCAHAHFTDVALTAVQVVSPVLVAALIWAAAKVASSFGTR